MCHLKGNMLYRVPFHWCCCKSQVKPIPPGLGSLTERKSILKLGSLNLTGMAKTSWHGGTRGAVLHNQCTTLWKVLVEAFPHPFLSSFHNEFTTTEGKNTQLSGEQDRAGATQLHSKGYSEWATLLEMMDLKCSSPGAPSTVTWVSGAEEQWNKKNLVG